MAYEHPKLTAFNDTLSDLFREADNFLEDEWGSAFPLHPNRPKRGETCSPEMDGLFELSPIFTTGFVSEYGRGYLIRLRVATLGSVPRAQFEYLQDITAGFIARKLPVYFPDRELRVVRESAPSTAPSYKIIGDFSLGSA
jgi:hypothetical protein